MRERETACRRGRCAGRCSWCGGAEGQDALQKSHGVRVVRTRPCLRLGGYAVALEPGTGIPPGETFAPFVRVGMRDPVMSDTALAWWDQGSGGASYEYLRRMDLQTGSVATVAKDDFGPVQERMSGDGPRLVWATRNSLQSYDASTKQLKSLGAIEERGEVAGRAADASTRHLRRHGRGLRDARRSSRRVARLVLVRERGGSLMRRERVRGSRATGSCGFKTGMASESSDNLVAVNVATAARRTVPVTDARGWDVDSGLLVYSGVRGTPSDPSAESDWESNVYAVDLNTGADSTVWDAEGVEMNPRLHGSNVVWEDAGANYGDAGLRVHIKSLVTGAHSVVTSGSDGGVHSPATNGKTFAWVEGAYRDARLNCAAIAPRAPTRLSIVARKVVTYGTATNVTGLLVDAEGKPLAGRADTTERLLLQPVRFEPRPGHARKCSHRQRWAFHLPGEAVEHRQLQRAVRARPR